jgi:hypothetical protein
MEHTRSWWTRWLDGMPVVTAAQIHTDCADNEDQANDTNHDAYHPHPHMMRRADTSIKCQLRPCIWTERLTWTD